MKKVFEILWRSILSLLGISVPGFLLFFIVHIIHEKADAWQFFVGYFGFLFMWSSALAGCLIGSNIEAIRKKWKEVI